MQVHGLEVGYPLDGAYIIPGLTYTNKHIHSYGRFRIIHESNLEALDCGRKRECKEGTHPAENMLTPSIETPSENQTLLKVEP